MNNLREDVKEVGLSIKESFNDNALKINKLEDHMGKLEGTIGKLGDKMDGLQSLLK